MKDKPSSSYLVWDVQSVRKRHGVAIYEADWVVKDMQGEVVALRDAPDLSPVFGVAMERSLADCDVVRIAVDPCYQFSEMSTGLRETGN
jgi:hypothetical protein